jgi:hypothetical protein
VSLNTQQSDKTCLAEMMIGGERVSNIHFLHYCKTHAIVSADPIDNLVDLLMARPAFGTPNRPAAYCKERIARRIRWLALGERLQPSHRSAAVP